MIDMDPSSNHDPDAYATAEAEHRHAVAMERVHTYLVTRDGFYGREAGDDDALDNALVGSGYEGTVPLLLSDLRILVGAPGPEAYDDRLGECICQWTPGGLGGIYARGSDQVWDPACTVHPPWGTLRAMRTPPDSPTQAGDA